MRSFHQLSLLSSIFLFPCSLSHAQHPYGHEKAFVQRLRHLNRPSGAFDVKKRDANVAFTYFSDGQGACGVTNGPNDFIVALNSAEYDNGAHCFEMITIVVNGKTAQAQITDECPGCESGGLDLSQGLFQFFASLDTGVLHGSWSYNSDITTSSSTSLPPTTLYTPTPTTIATTTTTSSTASSIATSLASTAIPTPTSTSASTSTTFTIPTSTAQDPQVITQINLALVELGLLLSSSFNRGE